MNALKFLAAAALAGFGMNAVAQDLLINNLAVIDRNLPGMDLRYQISVYVDGEVPVAGARVSATFPGDCTSVTWTCDDSQSPGACGGLNSGTGPIDATVNVTPDRGLSFVAYCRLRDPLSGSGPFVSTANIIPPTGVADPVSGNNTSTATIRDPLTGSYVRGSTTVAGDFVPGGTVTYTTVLTNTGPATQDGPLYEYFAVLPYGAIGDITAAASAGTVLPSERSIAWDVAIPSGNSVTLTVTGRIRPLSTGTVRQQGYVYFDYNGEGYNRGMEPTDDPSAPGWQDATVFTIVRGTSPVSIPLLTPLGLLALALGLFATAWRRANAPRLHNLR